MDQAEREYLVAEFWAGISSQPTERLPVWTEILTDVLEGMVNLFCVTTGR